MQPHPLQLPHYMLTFQGHEALQIYLFNSAVLVVALWLSRVLDLSCSKRWSTGGVASSRTRPLTPLVGKFSKSKSGPQKKIRPLHWRGGGESLEGRRTVTGGAEDSHWRGGGQSLEGRRTATGGAEDSDWNDRCPSGPPYPPPPPLFFPFEYRNQTVELE